MLANLGGIASESQRRALPSPILRTCGMDHMMRRSLDADNKAWAAAFKVAAHAVCTRFPTPGECYRFSCRSGWGCGCCWF